MRMGLTGLYNYGAWLCYGVVTVCGSVGVIDLLQHWAWWGSGLKTEILKEKTTTKKLMVVILYI